MLFNSIPFALFLPLIFVLYWFVFSKKLKYQNLLILVASYYFYSCWNWKFLFLLVFSTLLDYFSGIKMEDSKNQSVRRFWFWTSICVNIGFLGFFKYYNFFAENVKMFLDGIGFHTEIWTLNIILPVGISFYTFHGLSYVIDIYFGKIKAERNFVDYSLFVSYFPLLVAGPIERATHLLPQIKKERSFKYSNAVEGLKQILWGIFKKVVISDQCAEIANSVFNDPSQYSSTGVIFGAVMFAFQIYGDFSGYSDIALGTSRLFGMELLRNFAYPYFSRDIAEFWRRWHISLSSWFRDYLYIPLGGSKGSTWKKVRNTFIIFLVSGFWHGANWTFIIWGFLNALFIMPSILLNTNRNNLKIVAENSNLPSFRELISIIITFGLTVIAWVFFRAETVSKAFVMLKDMVSNKFSLIPENISYSLLLMLVIFLVVEWSGRRDDFAIKSLFVKQPRIVRYAFYYSIVLLVFLFAGSQQQFIYFQF